MTSWNEWTDGRIAKMLRAAVLPFLIGCVGLLPFYTKGTFIGDVGDARLNMYVMEHGYQTFHHRAIRFWDAPFFYPQKNVIAYSDHHLGNLPLYAAFRIVKLNRQASFQYWTLTTLALTFLSGYLALRSLGAGRLAASLAAYVFAFGLPVQAQAGHCQLLSRYLLPWVFVCAGRWAALGKTRDFAWVVALMVGQMYLGIYCGVLTAVPLAAYLLAIFLLGERKTFLRNMTGSGRTLAVRAAILLVAAAALLPIAIPYLAASREVGMRPWKEITWMLPRLNSWLYPPMESITWSWMRDVGLLGFRDLPFACEHQIFIGLTLLLSLLAWPFLRLSPTYRLALLANRAWWSLVFCFVLTLSVWGWTLWGFVFALPGFGAVRAVTRIALFMLFPISMVLAATLDALIAWARGRFSDSPEGEARAVGAGCLLALFVFVDNGVTGVTKTSFHTANLGVTRIKTALKAINPGHDYVFWVCQRDTEEPSYKVNLDAMLAAQDLGVATVNGYSGWAPPGYDLMPFPKGENSPYPFYQLKEWLDLKGVNAPSKLIVIDNYGQVAWNDPGRKECPLGKPIAFTDGHCEGYLGKGFSKPETDGIWTNRPWAEISLKVPEMPNRDIYLTLGINTLPLVNGKQNTYRLRVNGSEIGARAVTSAGALVWTLKVPREAASRKNGLLEIGIGSDLVLPIRECIPKSKDDRSVGLFLKTLSLE